MSVKASELLDVVTTLAKEQPDETRECRYFESEGGPCCIVGTGLAQLGVSQEQFLASGELNRFTDVYGLVSKGFVEADDRGAVVRLFNIQRYQDKGHPWALALTEAIEQPIDTEEDFYL